MDHNQQQEMDDDQWQQQNDLLERERLALDCLIVIHRDYEGTADTLAPLLGINRLWQQTKNDLAKRRLASVG